VGACSPSGGIDSVDFELTGWIDDIVGNVAALTDDDYCGAIAANPAKLVNMCVGINSGTGAVFVNGAYIVGYLSFDTVYFNRITLAA